MKRSSRASRVAFGLLLCFFATIPAHAEFSADPNYLLAFKKIYVEPVKDNVDGAFQAPVMQSYKEIFDRNPRFELVSDKAAADTVLRTSIEKKSSGLDLDITLLLAGTGEVFTQEHESIAATATGQETGAKVKALLKAALKRIPFYGTITGRDGRELTFDIGASHGLKKGDVIQISRIDNIKRHPLLKSIVDVQLVPVGDAEIDSAEDTISFGHVKSEITGEKIQKYQKVTAIEARAPEPQRKRDESADFGEAPATTSGQATDQGGNEDRPQIGWVSLGVGLGGLSNSTSFNSGVAPSGSGFDLGFKISGEVWLTKRWFADLMFGASTVSYSQETSTTGATATSVPFSTSTHTFGLSGGYKYLPTGDIYGPQVFVKLGYMNWAWSTPVSKNDFLSSKSYSGLNLGIGGVLPVSGVDWGLMLNVNVLLFPGLSEDDAYKVLGTDTSASGATFFLGGYHYFNPKLAARAGLQIEIFSADASAAGSSTSQKTFSFMPSIVYYF